MADGCVVPAQWVPFEEWDPETQRLWKLVAAECRAEMARRESLPWWRRRLEDWGVIPRAVAWHPDLPPPGP
jgi:hypothetical protein